MVSYDDRLETGDAIKKLPPLLRIPLPPWPEKTASFMFLICSDILST